MNKEQIGAARVQLDECECSAETDVLRLLETAYALLDALEEADIEGMEQAVETRDRILKYISADRDHWKARAEALERAIRSVAPRMTPCDLCANWNDDGCLRPESCSIWTPHGKDNWQFDQTRFERSGDNAP